MDDYDNLQTLRLEFERKAMHLDRGAADHTSSLLTQAQPRSGGAESERDGDGGVARMSTRRSTNGVDDGSDQDDEEEDICLVFSLHHEYAVVLIQERWRARKRERMKAQAAIDDAARSEKNSSLQA